MKTEIFFILSLVISGVSFTVTVTSIFKPVREIVSKIHHKIEELIHCPWCFSHWLTFILLLIIGEWIEITGKSVLDFLLTSFGMITISGVIHYVLLRAYEPVAKMMVERQIEKMKAKPKS